MSRINSLVGPAPTTFLSSSGPTNTWLDDYIDNPVNLGNGSFHNNHGIFQDFPYEIKPELKESRWDTLDLRPGMDGFSGPPTLEIIPNYNPENDPGITKMANATGRMANATDPEWLNIIKTLTGKLG